MIIVSDLTKKFGKIRAVDDVSFEVERGEIFGLLGPNGAGKTTTIRMLIGLSWPTAGEARIDGLDPTTEATALHRRIGVVAEAPNLYERLSVRYNLELFAKLLGGGAADVDAVVRRFLLQEVLGRAAGTLSKGWKQRVLIARALLHRPRVVFLDEPTSGLDPNSSIMIRRIITELREEGVTVVLCTHNMDEADQLCDRVGFMYQGRLATVGPPDRLKAADGPAELVVERLTDGRRCVERRPLRDPATAGFVYELLLRGEVTSIATHERTLADVFTTVTGGELS